MLNYGYILIPQLVTTSTLLLTLTLNGVMGGSNLKGYFLAFGPSIIGFNSGRPTLLMDGTFLHVN